MKSIGLLVFGSLLLCSCGSGLEEDKGNGNGNTVSVSWTTDRASLKADDFYIVANGQTFTTQGGYVNMKSDPGDAQYCTLEMIWQEKEVEMRLFIYFEADGTDWWSNEFRTYNGQATPDENWIYYKDIFFKSKLGQPFTGDVDFSSNDGGVGKVHFTNLRLQAFL